MKSKRILVLGIALLLTVMVVGVAFAQKEYEYTVTVYYTDKVSGGLREVTYTLWASSAEQATQMATARCEREKGDAASCGGAIATGRTRGN